MVLTQNANRLIVEGEDDLHSVAELMGAHIPWPQEKQNAPVEIVVSNGADQILRKGFLTAHIIEPRDYGSWHNL